jgi:hypothetical protein
MAMKEAVTSYLNKNKPSKQYQSINIKKISPPPMMDMNKTKKAQDKAFNHD